MLPSPAVGLESRLPAEFWSILNNQAVLQVTGPDARRFLQGQVTCHMDELTPENSLLGAACTPKGRAYTSFRLTQIGDKLLIAMDASLVNNVLNHLAKYAALFKTRLTQTDDWRIIGLCGKRLAEQLLNGAPAPLTTGQAAQLPEGALVRVHDSLDHPDCFELWTTRDQLDSLKNQLGDAHQQPESCWQLGRIRAGQAWITEASQEAWVPQMFNWQRLDGINFRKGCYTGQEIIARMHYLGQLKKGLYRVSFSSTDTPHIGSLIQAGQADGSISTAGELLNLLALEEYQYEALAVINHAQTDHPLFMNENRDNPVHLHPLPHVLSDQAKAETKDGSQAG